MSFNHEDPRGDRTEVTSPGPQNAPVATALNDLHGEISILDDLLTTLGSRLAPVTVSSPTEVAQRDGVKPLGDSAVARGIHEAVLRVAALQMTVRAYIGGLEI